MLRLPPQASERLRNLNETCWLHCRCSGWRADACQKASGWAHVYWAPVRRLAAAWLVVLDPFGALRMLLLESLHAKHAKAAAFV